MGRPEPNPNWDRELQVQVQPKIVEHGMCRNAPRGHRLELSPKDLPHFLNEFQSCRFSFFVSCSLSLSLLTSPSSYLF